MVSSVRAGASVRGRRSGRYKLLGGRQAPLSMEFSRQEYWSGLPLPSPGDLPNTRVEPRFPTLQEDSLPMEAPGKSYSSFLCDISAKMGSNFLTQVFILIIS